MLINKDESCIVIFGMQKEFIPSLIEGQKTIDSCRWLLDLSNDFDIPAIIIEHKDLGEPLQSLISVNKKIKTHVVKHFSFFAEEKVKDNVLSLNKKHLILAGAESHISIMQSAFDAKNFNLDVFIIADACTSRNFEDHKFALKRMNYNGINIATKEMMFFEFLRFSEYPHYINMSLKYLDRRYIRD